MLMKQSWHSLWSHFRNSTLSLPVEPYNWAIGGVGAQSSHTVHTWWSRAIRILAYSSICHADRSICQNWFWLCARNSLWNLFIRMFNKRRWNLIKSNHCCTCVQHHWRFTTNGDSESNVFLLCFIIKVI